MFIHLQSEEIQILATAKMLHDLLKLSSSCDSLEHYIQIETIKIMTSITTIYLSLETTIRRWHEN